jgi:LysR family transcriptional regulator, glycine cleavage system transcriptional activator
MGRDIPPWPALEAFVAAARCGSFRQAAEQLGLSAPAFTRRIQTLEHHVGVRLFERDGQQTRLTPAGRDYVDLVEPGFESLRAATAMLAPDARMRPLRLRISHTLATVWLAPRLARFHALHPDINLQMQSVGTPGQLHNGLIDVGIFFSRTPFEDLVVQKLFALEAFVVAAPQMLERPIATLEDLACAPLLDLTDPGEIWPEWLQAAGFDVPPPRPRFLFDSIEVMYQAASAGAGFALGLRPLVDPFLADGRLHIALTRRHAMPGAYYVVATRQVLRHAAARKLWRWIGKEGEAGAMAPDQTASRPVSGSAG